MQCSDSVVWLVTSNEQNSTELPRETIRIPREKVQWAAVVWCEQNFAKWSFVWWPCCRRKLATTDRLIKEGMNVDEICGLCNEEKK